MSEQQTLPTIVPDAAQRRALLEAIVYVAEEPLTIEQIASGLDLDPEVIQADLAAMIEESGSPARGVEIRMVARGYKMFTNLLRNPIFQHRTIDGNWRSLYKRQRKLYNQFRHDYAW